MCRLISDDTRSWAVYSDSVVYPQNVGPTCESADPSGATRRGSNQSKWFSDARLLYIGLYTGSIRAR